MSAKSILIVGLGNYSPRYELTRHNIGFLLMDALSEDMECGNFKKWKGLGLYTSANYSDKKVFIAKPLTYMNLSGNMVIPFSRFFDIPIANIIVCYDDVSLELGRIRLRQKGSAGGQKGIEHILTMFGNEGIARLKLGIGFKPKHKDLSDFVLSNFNKNDQECLEKGLTKGVEAIKEYLRNGIEVAMNKFN